MMKTCSLRCELRGHFGYNKSIKCECQADINFPGDSHHNKSGNSCDLRCLWKDELALMEWNRYNYLNGKGYKRISLFNIAVAPFWERGLKYIIEQQNSCKHRRSFLGAWIEMYGDQGKTGSGLVAPFWERGLKWIISTKHVWPPLSLLNGNVDWNFIAIISTLFMLRGSFIGAWSWNNYG